jgi:hypothetical protein
MADESKAPYRTDAVFIVGLPPRFSLESALAGATCISLATAFVRKSGWQLIAPLIEGSQARVRLIAGLDFCQTDPSVLRAWLRLQTTRPKVEAYVASGRERVFHPKVLVVESGRTAFAIVGSGNLTAGGLLNNVECGVFVRDRRYVRALLDWFARLQADRRATLALTAGVIDDYAPSFESAARSLANVRRLQEQAGRVLATSAEGRLRHRDRAVLEARRYFRSAGFRSDWKDWSKAVREIRRLLRGPAFDFSNDEWRRFYAIWKFGHLIPLNRDRAVRRAARLRLQAGLRQLVDHRKPALERLDAVLDKRGRFHIPGVGVNVVSKILAVHSAGDWPVYNGAVAEALEQFGYTVPRGLTRGARYLAFADEMGRFGKEVGIENLLKLDPFFWRTRERRRP